MAKKLILEIPITEEEADGNVYYDLDFKALIARTDLPESEREGILEVYGQSDYIYTELATDIFSAFANAPTEELP